MYGFLHAVIAATAGVVLFRLCVSISSYIWAIAFVLRLLFCFVFVFCQMWDKCSLGPQNDPISVWPWEVQIQHLCTYWDFENKFTHCTVAHWGDNCIAEFLVARTLQFASSGSSLYLCHSAVDSGLASRRRQMFMPMDTEAFLLSFGRFTAAIPTLELMATCNRLILLLA